MPDTKLKTTPMPGCFKTYGWVSRTDARANLLERWSKGDFRCSGTHWCRVHGMFHLTSKPTRSGSNYLYRD